ncbi:MAG: acyl--CoA ligase [Actinobacteria bacterium]|nr:acyl--CoA ligase [Actinomycetota bacterium]
MGSTTVAQLLAANAHRADRPWVVTPDERLTYGDADARSAVLARRFLAEGIGKNTRVAIVLANSADWVVAFLALSRIGAHSALLSPFGKPPELAYALRHADVHAVVTGTRAGGVDAAGLLAAAVPGLADHRSGTPLLTESHPYLRRVWWFGDDRPQWADDPDAGGPVDAGPLAAVEAEIAPSDPLLTSYTSGTTADPKAVMHSHGAILRQAAKLAVRRKFVEDDVVYTPMPFFWVGGVCYALLSCATEGMLLCTSARFDAGQALDLMEEGRATHVACWPQAAENMVAHPSWPERDLSHLKAGPALLRGPVRRGRHRPAGAEPRDDRDLRAPHLLLRRRRHPARVDARFVRLAPREHGAPDRRPRDPRAPARRGDRRAVDPGGVPDARLPQAGAPGHLPARRLVPHW